MSDLIFHYKVLGSPIKLTHAEMNQNLRSIEEAVDIVQNAELVSSNASDLAVNAAAVATQAKEDAVTAKGQAESAREDAVIAKNAAEQANTGAQAAKDTAVSASTTAQGAKTAAELARNDSVAARNIAQTSATTATSAKNAAETARNTATQKATEASSSATDAAQSAAEAKESASAVTSVQGKQGEVALVRADFPWMGNAAERNVGTDAGNVMGATDPRVVYAKDFLAGNSTLNAFASPDDIAVTSIVYSKGTNSTGLFTDGAIYSQHYSSSWGHFIYGDYRTGNLAVRGNNNGSLTPWIKLFSEGNLPQATEAELNAGTQTAPRIYAPKTFYDAAAFTAHNIANPLNLSAGNNFTISITVNSTLANPTGAKSGQTGTLYINHDESLTLSFGSAWKFIGDIPELPTGAGDAVITYQVVDATTILATFGVIE